MIDPAAAFLFTAAFIGLALGFSFWLVDPNRKL
jgi:hypothetical protein